MLGQVVTKGWYRAAPLLLLPGCLVSFNDYPLGASGGATAGNGAGGTTTGGSGMNADAGAEASGGAGPVSSAPAAMIDDFEDGDEGILEQEGRSGSWYAVNDGQGMQTPAPNMAVLPSPINPPRGDSERGAHTFGGPFGVWGALIGTSLASSGNDGLPYDVTDYQGIRFWVRSGAINPVAAEQVHFVMPTPQTSNGGGCTVCNDHFGAFVPLTSQWVRIELRFSDLAQEGFGMPQPPSPDLQRVTAIQFTFPKDVSFDLWVDDIELF